MKARLTEIQDGKGNVAVAIIWVRVASTGQAWGRLANYIDKYVGRRPHNLYVHNYTDTVAAVISFTMEEYPGVEIEI